MLATVKRLARGLPRQFSRAVFQLLPGAFGDGRLERGVWVQVGGIPRFQMRDFGPLSRLRARSFAEKEPETLRWIEAFERDSLLLDVGANVGLFSLYAASRGVEVIAVEPDALNFALLNQNTRLNEEIVGDRIRAFCLALHGESKISTLNVSSGEWGSALNSFDNDVDFGGRTFKPQHRQGSIGMRLDDFLTEIQFRPTHIKIDVDGNEREVLAGAISTLRDPALISVLVELDERRPDYSECVEVVAAAGFTLIEKTHSELYSKGDFSSSYNHIFARPRGH